MWGFTRAHMCTHTHTWMCIDRDCTERKYCDIWYLEIQGLNSRAINKGADVWHLTNEILYVKLFLYINLKERKLPAYCNEHISPLKRDEMGNLIKQISQWSSEFMFIQVSDFIFISSRGFFASSSIIQLTQRVRGGILRVSVTYLNVFFHQCQILLWMQTCSSLYHSRPWVPHLLPVSFSS